MSPTTGSELLLDTNAVIALMNDASILLPVLSPNAELVLTVISLGELKYGALNSTRVVDNVGKIEQALSQFRLITPDKLTTDFYASVRIQLKKSGRPIPANDTWIAALALQHRLPLITADRHFREVQGLDVRVW